MSGCMRTKNYELAWQAYEMMCANHVNPDGTTLSTLLPGMVAAHNWDRVLILARRALAATPKQKVPAEVLNRALSQMLSSGKNCSRAEQLQDLMKGAGIPIRVSPQRR